MTDQVYRAKEVVQQDFDKITNYDEKRDMYYFERRLRRLLEVVPEQKNAVILDFGGGSGLFSLELKKRGYTNLHLLDLSSVQCSQARDKGLVNVHCGDENYLAEHFSHAVHADSEQVSADSEGKSEGTFDFVFMCDVIEHVEHPVEVLRKIRMVLKPHGRIFMTYPNPYWVPVLNVLGNIGLKLKGKDNRIHISKLRRALLSEFNFEVHEGHMLVSKLPKGVLGFFEFVEKGVPRFVRRRTCLLNVAILQKK